MNTFCQVLTGFFMLSMLCLGDQTLYLLIKTSVSGIFVVVVLIFLLSLFSPSLSEGMFAYCKVTKILLYFSLGALCIFFLYLGL